jgi:hypothetical protein
MDDHPSQRSTDPAGASPSTSPSRRPWRWCLVAVLRLHAVVMGLALVAVLLPTDWMAAIDRSFGLAPLPRLPLVEYLTRSLSAFYTFEGVLAWLVSTDLRRFAPLVTYLGVTRLLLGGLLLVVDLRVGMPISWTVTEAIATLGGGAALLILQRLARSEAERA